MKFILYTKENCQWCRLAKEFLTDRGYEYQEKKLLVDFQRDDLQKLVGENVTRLTLPQVTDIEGGLIGNYEEMKKYVNKLEGKTND